MIVTSRFVFLHLHKSGGTFVNRFLQRFVPDALQIGYHLPRSCLPERYARLPIFGLVRNPWDYYVSWYSFQLTRPSPNPVFLCVSDDGRLGFPETIRNLISLGEHPDRFAKVRSQLPEAFTGQGINLTRNCLQSLAGSAEGFYTFMYRRMYGDDRELTIGRMESLRIDLADFLARVGMPVTEQMADYIRHEEPANRTPHPVYAALYDDATRDAVAARDAYVIGRFGYRFEFVPPRHDFAVS